MSFIHTTSLIAILCYFAATFSVVSRLFHEKGPNHVLVLFFACCAIVPHVLVTTNMLFTTDEINFNLPNVITLVSLVIALLITLTALKYKVSLLMPVAYAFAGSWILATLFMPAVSNIPLTASKIGLVTHITFSLIAYCVLVIACLYSFQVSYINIKLKEKNLMVLNHLPPLMLVERQLYIILAIGTLCLIATQVTGTLFLDSFFSKANAHKTVLSFIALLIYCVILWGHFRLGWRGHKVQTLTIIATVILTLSYFGSRFVKEFLL